MESLFKDWKERCSGLGHIMTNLNTKEEIERINANIKSLEDERDKGVNANGNTVKWTDAKKNKLNDLKTKRDAPDELSSGIKTHLDDVFRSIFWKRTRLLHNKFLDKGNLCEEDSLGVLSLVDGSFYKKNDKLLENDWIKGTPDNNQGIIRDTKSNWDMESFDKAELSNIYQWQIKGYCWLDKKTKGELDYCLVNNPLHQIVNEKQRVWYAMGTPDNDDERWIEAAQQIERNMIFDIPKFKLDYPGYEFENTILDFDMPAICRVKKFQVELMPEDIKNIKRRVDMCRVYLMEKERVELEKITNFKKLIK